MAARRTSRQILIHDLAPRLDEEIGRARRDAALIALFGARESGVDLPLKKIRDIMERQFGYRYGSDAAMCNARKRAQIAA